MLSPEEFAARWEDNGLARIDPISAARWGSDDLIPCALDRVENLTIPQTAKRFLMEAGLPRKAYRTFSFAIGTSALLSLPELLTDRDVPSEYQRYRIIGIEYFDAPEDWETQRVIVRFICLDEKKKGCVVSIKNSPEVSVEFFNSSVQQLAEFFLILRSGLEQAIVSKLITDEEYDAHGQAISQMLGKADPEAAQSGTGWYSTIQQMELGM